MPSSIWVINQRNSRYVNQHLKEFLANLRIALAWFFRYFKLVVIGEVAQEQKGEHVVAEVVRVHRPAQLVGDRPEGVAELLLAGVAHGVVGAGLALQAESRSASRGLSLLNWLTPRVLNGERSAAQPAADRSPHPSPSFSAGRSSLIR